MSGLCYAPRCQNSVAGLLLLEPADKIVDSKTFSVSFNPGVVLANAQARFAGRFCFMPTGSNFVGKHPHNWKGGRTVTQHGYVLIYVSKNHPLADCRGYAYEHRLWSATDAPSLGKVCARSMRRGGCEVLLQTVGRMDTRIIL